MANPITVGHSPLTNRIFVGRSKPMKNGPEGARMFTGEKHDVTQEAVFAVAHHMVQRDDIVVIPMPDGTFIHLRADVKESDNG